MIRAFKNKTTILQLYFDSIWKSSSNQNVIWQWLSNRVEISWPQDCCLVLKARILNLQDVVFRSVFFLYFNKLSAGNIFWRNYLILNFCTCDNTKYKPNIIAPFKENTQWFNVLTKVSLENRKQRTKDESYCKVVGISWPKFALTCKWTKRITMS